MVGPFTEIGKIVKPHNLEGQVKVHVEKKYLPSLQHTAWIFLELFNSKVPFQILDRDGEDSSILTLDDVNSRTEAAQLRGAKIFIQEKDLILNEAEISGFDLLLGFSVLDNNGERIGTITRIEQYPEQLMASIKSSSGIHLIPLNDEFIQSIDIEEQVCEMDLPDGLLEL